MRKLPDRLVVAAGPWLPNLIDSLSVVLPLEIERQLSHWFSPTQRDARYEPERCPIGLWELAGEVFATSAAIEVLSSASMNAAMPRPMVRSSSRSTADTGSFDMI